MEVFEGFRRPPRGAILFSCMHSADMPRTSHYLASEPLKLASEPADLLLFERQERTLSTIGNNNI